MKTVIILKKYKISKAIATVCHRTDADKVLGYHKRQRAIELSQKRMTAHLVGILINGTLLIRFTNHVNWHYTGYLCSEAWEGSSEGLEAGRLATGPTGSLQRRRISVWASR